MTGRKSTRFVLLILFALAPAAALLAATPATWQPIAPAGGRATFLAVEPRSGQVFAATRDSGIYRSDDRGQSWTSANHGLPPLLLGYSQVWAGPGAVYASGGGALYKTTDGGRSWLKTGYTGEISQLAIAPSAPDVLYIAHYFAGFWRSDDGGATWRNLTANLPPGPSTSGHPNLTPSAVAVAPADPQTVYIATYEGPFLKSADGGGHWTAAGTLPQAPKFYSQLTIDPGAPGTLYVLGGGLFRSTDRGVTWKRLGDVFPSDGFPTDFAVLGGSTPRLYVTVLRFRSNNQSPLSLLYVSRDRGTTWQLVRRSPVLTSVAVDPGHPRRLYLGSYPQGVLWSADFGAHFSPASGFRDAMGLDVALSPTTAGEIYLVTSLGLQKSVDGGTTWTALSAFPGVPYRLRPDRTTAGLLYGTTQGGDVSLYKSADDGRTWQATSLPKMVVEDLAIDPMDARHLLAVGWVSFVACNGFDCVTTSAFKAYASIDGGATWTAFGDALEPPGTIGLFRGARFDPANSKNVYLFGDASFRSTDGGATWTQIFLHIGIEDLALDPFSPSTLLATLQGGQLYRSTDGGRSWAALPNSLFLPVRLAFDPHVRGKVYASDGFAGEVWSSSDGGATWLGPHEGLPGSRVQELVVDPFPEGGLFAVLPSNSGLFTLAPEP